MFGELGDEFEEHYLQFLRTTTISSTSKTVSDFDGYNDVKHVEFREGTALQVYFTSLKREYNFYFVAPTSIFISGDTLPNSVIQCVLKGKELHMDSFYYVHSKDAKSFMKSENFQGYGPRGMFLVKYIAKALGIDYVTVSDYWEHGDIDSEKLKTLLQSGETESIAHWAQFYTEKGTLETAKKHGYYGGFGFEPSEKFRVLKARVQDIQCSSKM